MSTYESTSGLGVGKHYGPTNVGGVGGKYMQVGSANEIVFELTAGEIPNGAPWTMILEPFYRVEAIYYEVEQAFAASSTANLTIGGGVALTTPIPLSSLSGVTSAALTGLTNTVGNTNTTTSLVFTGNANTVASTTGKARVIVQYKTV